MGKANSLDRSKETALTPGNIRTKPTERLVPPRTLTTTGEERLRTPTPRTMTLERHTRLDRSSAGPRTRWVDSRQTLQRRWDSGCSIACLLTTVHPERALSRALIQHLGHELPDVDFTLRTDRPCDAVWVCGYEPGRAELVRRIRARYPNALLLVTGRGPTELWAGEVLRAGADSVYSWPLPYRRLSRILHGAERQPR